MNVIVLMNARAGATPNGAEDQQAHDVRVAMEAVGVRAQVRSVPAAELADLAREAVSSGVAAVVASGGDGTISAVAGALAGTKTPLGVLPSGTLNHFSKDLGIPQDLAAAARVIAAGQVRVVDVGEVNGRVFVNNSSIGIYPRIVVHRDQQRERLGRGKWLAMLRATMWVFRRFPTVRVRLGIGNQSVPCTTPFVFIGNNRYELSLLQLGARTRLDRGELCLYFARRSGRFGLFLLASRAVLGLLRQAKDFEMTCLPEAWIDSAKRRLRVAVDGEVIELAPPLHYRIRPGALRVLAPAGGEEPR